MHKKFEINWTKIKGGCQSGRKVIPHNSRSDLPLTDIKSVTKCDFLFSDLVITSEGGAAAAVTEEDPSHTRNSSTTSQASVGYSSQNSQPGHSRQSSSGGESSHGRYDF